MGKKPIYTRALLKLSGEVLMGKKEFGLDTETVGRVADELKEVHGLGVELAVVVGGGNIIRGLAASEAGIERVTGDYMGMLGTVINALALQDALEKRGVDTRTQTALDIPHVGEPFIRRRAISHLEKKRVVIFAAGVGSPFFTTDSGAALRANEINADVLLKATKVPMIYTADPEKDPDAKPIEEITHKEVLVQRLGFMDASAIDMCCQTNMPIQLFKMEKGNITQAVCGEKVGSVVRS